MAAEEAKTDHSALNIYQKLAAITGEIGVIKKDGTNRDQGYAFIEYAAVSGKLRTLFADYGVVIVPRMQRAAKQHRAEVTSSRGAKGVHALIDFYFDVVNADKPEDHFVVQWTGEAMGYDDKITNKAATSALKYYLMRQFNISEKGDDPDAETPESVESSRPAPRATVASTNREPSEKQLGLIKTLAKRKGKDDAWTDGALGKIKSSADASAVIDKLQELEDA